jgi:hypothetical protein
MPSPLGLLFILLGTTIVLLVVILVAVSILTFNYDMYVEMALDNKKVTYVYFLTVGDLIPKLKLLQVHG